MKEIRNSIILSDIERELLIFRGIKEGFIVKRNSSYKNKDDEYISLLRADNISLKKATYILKKIYQNILLYDEIISPSVQTFNFNTEKLESTGFFKFGVFDEYGTQDTSYLFKNGKLPDIDWEYSQYIKPIIIGCLLKVFRRDNEPVMNIINSYNTTLRKYLSFFYDHLFTDPVTKSPYFNYLVAIHNYDAEEVMWDSGKMLDSEIADFISYFSNNLLFCLEKSTSESAVISGNDFDLSCFKKFKIDKNISNECYELLKVELINEIDMLPSFKSLSEVLIFKEKNKKNIERLRSIISELEYLLRNGMRTKAISTARSDISKAIKELSRYNQLEKISRWITLLSVPIGIAELLLNSSLVSLGISTIGFTNQISMDMCKKRNNWIYLIR